MVILDDEKKDTEAWDELVTGMNELRLFSLSQRKQILDVEDDINREVVGLHVPSIPDLTEEEEDRVSKTLRKGQSGFLSEYKSAYLEYKDIYRLYPETWLNDEIINYYFELIADRQWKNQKLPSVHCYTTFFCSALREHGYDKVRRWTKRVDIFTKDLLLIPINQSYHWTLGVIDMKRKTISVYDSLGGNHDHTLSLLLKYLQQEHKDKKKQEYDVSGWTLSTPKDIPLQQNMSDCGVFTCYYAERLSANKPFDFTQDDMIVLRRRMVLNILDKHL
ncbi:hypothetical protein BDB01DRAFT_294491 [Pilobolus umbonatus]|nr:hypothetical protein BDB01DRAFT_294491 [Pilobolus umbonatus]